MSGKEIAIKSLLFFVPMIVCYLMNYFCPVTSDAGSSVSWRPPAAWFGIIWAILFVLLGLSWAFAKLSSDNIILYGLLVFSLAAWTYVYSCLDLKPGGIVAIFFAIVLICVLMQFQMKSNRKSALLLLPLLLWLCFAMALNIAEIK